MIFFSSFGVSIDVGLVVIFFEVSCIEVVEVGDVFMEILCSLVVFDSFVKVVFFVVFGIELFFFIGSFFCFFFF